MIEKTTVCQIVNEWLQGKDYFLVEVTVNPDDRIVVEIDHKDGVWIEDCVELSRYIESRLDRDREDYELEVGSAGIGQPFKVLQQYVLKEATEDHFAVTIQKKVKPEGAKRPHMEAEDITLRYEDINYTKYVISFK